jgi:hypothetical protein
MKTGGTPIYARQHRRGLILPQRSAIDLLAAGKTDTATAELLGLSRTCVAKWRLYDIVCQATLNRRRAEVWSVGIDRLRSLIPQALDVLTEELDKRNRPNRLKAAAEILRLAPLSAAALAVGPTEPEDIVAERRRQAPGLLDDLQDHARGLPPVEAHKEAVWQELDARTAEAEEPPA